jgi:hypothetical protein
MSDILHKTKAPLVNAEPLLSGGKTKRLYSQLNKHLPNAGGEPMTGESEN